MITEKNRKKELKKLFSSCSQKFNKYRGAFKPNDYVLIDLRTFSEKLDGIFQSLVNWAVEYEFKTAADKKMEFYAEIFTILGFIEAIKNIYGATSLKRFDDSGKALKQLLDSATLSSLNSEISVRKNDLMKFLGKSDEL